MGNEAATVGADTSRLPAGLVPGLRERATEVAHRILQEIQRSIPAYSRPLEGTFGRAIVDGIEHGVRDFIDRMVHPGGPGPETAELFRQLGKYEVAEGRGIDVLHSAYRIGARVGWQALSDFGQRAGLPVATMCELAENLFAYIDELSSLSYEGYTAAQARVAGALERRRKRLLELLLADPPVPSGVLVEQSAAAGWELPGTVAVVVLDAPDGAPAPSQPEVAADVLVDLESPAPCLVVPAPGGEVPDLEPALAGWRAVVGPVVDVTAARDSLRWARHLLALLRHGVLPDRPVTWCADHLTTLWLLADTELARQLVRQAVEPLDSLSGKQRERLAETLSAWLEIRGGAPEVAAHLDVHPQTVRYRLHQLDELYGGRLRDADERFALTVALRARRILRLLSE
ncbi:PucR-like helix-turn-helix protein [Prauserella shujinwangii]|uniref:PucR-like helix-turn-helix protein n=1 Tax=Prauserella shujinwangii TaxID=1453103 RepID=A0A2T0LMQ2_9PSEU|nr:PucR family transcriptional regulator [Prauserella shujinwangii]PRX44356.1 PucR-like helix-turn-helix protein [Prauserella shujinwangii]